MQQLTAIERSVGWASRAMNTTEICQTRQPWCCDQQSFLTAAMILAFKGILRQIYVGPAVRLCVHAFVGAVSAVPAPLGDLPYPLRRKRRLFRLAIVSFAIGRRCSDPISHLSLHPSAYPPPPPYSPTHISSPLPRPGW